VEQQVRSGKELGRKAERDGGNMKGWQEGKYGKIQLLKKKEINFSGPREGKCIRGPGVWTNWWWRAALARKASSSGGNDL